jgi:hypothetical protein
MHLTHPPHDVESTGQASASVIKITPEMVEAGIRALYAYDNDPMFCSAEECVERIYRAMMEVRSTAMENTSDRR